MRRVYLRIFVDVVVGTILVTGLSALVRSRMADAAVSDAFYIVVFAALCGVAFVALLRARRRMGQRT